MTNEEMGTVVQAFIILNSVGVIGGAVTAWKQSINLAVKYNNILRDIQDLKLEIEKLSDQNEKNERDINHAHNKIRFLEP